MIKTLLISVSLENKSIPPPFHPSQNKIPGSPLQRNKDYPAKTYTKSTLLLAMEGTSVSQRTLPAKNHSFRP